MNQSKNHNLILSGLFIATGIILPMFFHYFGLLGKIMLPMHIPVLVAGFVLKPKYALLVGVITPFISSVLTGMPVLFPNGPIMMIELGTYGLITSLLHYKTKTHFIVSLAGAMLIGRIMAGFAVMMLVILFGIKLNPITFVTGAVVAGMPGIILQLLFIPTLIVLLNKYLKIK